MNRLLKGASALVIAFSAIGGAAFAKPVNAATVQTPNNSSGCVVRVAAPDPYVFDPTCTFQTVLKRNKDGSLRSWRYHDQGELQPGQTPPDRAVRTEIEQFISGVLCSGYEIASPSGQYSSNLVCDF